jgi:oligopeptidase B
MIRLPLILLLLLGTAAFAQQPPVLPPVAKVIPKELTIHGDTRVDPYYWLNDKSNPDVIRYLEAENRYTEAVMRDTEKLQAKLYSEMLSRIKETDITPPSKIGDYYYYWKSEQGKPREVLCRKKARATAREEVILDLNQLAAGRKYLKFGNWAVSPNHRFLAYQVETKPAWISTYTIFFKDLNTGRLVDQIPNTHFHLAWAADNKTLFYGRRDPWRVLRHVLGSSSENDVAAYQYKDGSWLWLRTTSSREYILICRPGEAAWPYAEVSYLKADRPQDDFKVIQPRQPGTTYYVSHRGRQFFIAASDSGKEFRLFKAPVNSPTRAYWEEVRPHREPVVIEFVEAFRNHVVIVEREKGLQKIHIHNLTTNQFHHVDFDEPAYAVFLSCDEPESNVFLGLGATDFKSNIVRFGYTSLVTPLATYDYNMDTKHRQLRSQEAVPGGYDPGRYQAEGVFAGAPDGVRVPVSLVYKRGLVRNGKSPLLLHGYGYAGITMDPSFASARLSLLDRGFIYAIAHVRGGGEMGEGWHDSGQGRRKMNSFTDFIACAEYLVAQKYTSAERLAMMGRSSGGLLVGAVASMRPDLFQAVVAQVPWLDLIVPEADSSRLQYPGELGDPNEKGDYEYIRLYSPYDNVKAQAYPNMLITAGFNDDSLEPAKWAARLRAAKTDHNLLLLKMNMESAHSGASDRYERLKATAFEYAFLLKALGIEE